MTVCIPMQMNRLTIEESYFPNIFLADYQEDKKLTSLGNLMSCGESDDTE